MTDHNQPTDILTRLRHHQAVGGLTGELFRLAADEIERLRGVELAAGNLDRYSLVVESAVRNADPGNSDGVTDAILRLRGAMGRNTVATS